MKKIILIVLVTISPFVIIAQENRKVGALEQDQNPNYKIAMSKYAENYTTYTSQQATTAQETYKAIDPLEEKREMRSIRRKYRSQKPYWRHQRRLERAKNTRDYSNNRGYGYRNGNFIGRNQRFRNHNYFGNNLLSLGILGGAACLIR